MARPTKAAATTVGHFTSEEIKNRIDNETKLKGESDKLKPPSYLTTPQKKIFRYILTNLEASGILGNLDIYVLTECSICIDRMQTIEKKINESDLLDPALVAVKEKSVSSVTGETCQYQHSNERGKSADKGSDVR